jgi:DNA-binding MarR family transcriptional regulator
MKNSSQLGRELGMSRPFSSLGQEAALSVLHTADLVRRHLAAAMEGSGVTLQQFNVLRILRGAGPEGLPTLTIAERMIEHAPGITRLIDRLAKKGWVERRRGVEDRRCVYCTITDAGRQILDQLSPAVEAADSSVLEMLDQDEQRRLVELLDKVRAAESA